MGDWPAFHFLSRPNKEVQKRDVKDNSHHWSHWYAGAQSYTLASKNISEGRTPNKYAFDREVEQGINIAEVAASPTALKTLKRFVLSSLSDARKWSHGKYTYVYHNDANAEIIRTVQTRFPELAAQMSTVQIGHYSQIGKPPHLWRPRSSHLAAF